VQELKQQFNANTWQGTFSAREGFVVVPVKRMHFPKVWSAVNRLAKRHDLACYDPEGNRLVVD
jgi:hypothetical protein